jgi:uncharacterized protein YkwD
VGLCVAGLLAGCGGGGDGSVTAASTAATTSTTQSSATSDQATAVSTTASMSGSTATPITTTTSTTSASSSAVPAGQTQCGDPLAGRAVAALLDQLRAQGTLCGDAAQPPVAALRWDDRLAAAAARQAADSAAMGVVTHVGSDGSDVAQRVANAGFSAWGVGENAAAGVPTAARVLALWQDSPPHCTNMMSSQYTDVGVACATDARSPWGEHWIMVLARAAGTY